MFTFWGKKGNFGGPETIRLKKFIHVSQEFKLVVESECDGGDSVDGYRLQWWWGE